MGEIWLTANRAEKKQGGREREGSEEQRTSLVANQRAERFEIPNGKPDQSPSGSQKAKAVEKGEQPGLALGERVEESVNLETSSLARSRQTRFESQGDGSREPEVGEHDTRLALGPQKVVNSGWLKRNRSPRSPPQARVPKFFLPVFASTSSQPSSKSTATQDQLPQPA